MCSYLILLVCVLSAANVYDTHLYHDSNNSDTNCRKQCNTDWLGYCEKADTKCLASCRSLKKEEWEACDNKWYRCQRKCRGNCRKLDTKDFISCRKDCVDGNCACESLNEKWNKCDIDCRRSQKMCSGFLDREDNDPKESYEDYEDYEKRIKDKGFITPNAYVPAKIHEKRDTNCRQQCNSDWLGYCIALRKECRKSCGTLTKKTKMCHIDCFRSQKVCGDTYCMEQCSSDWTDTYCMEKCNSDWTGYCITVGKECRKECVSPTCRRGCYGSQKVCGGVLDREDNDPIESYEGYEGYEKRIKDKGFITPNAYFPDKIHERSGFLNRIPGDREDNDPKESYEDYEE